MGLERYERFKFTHPAAAATERPIAHDVYRLERPGTAAVIILHEIFGLSETAIGLADHLADLDPPFSVYLPHLFGSPGKGSPANALRAFCVRREFRFFVTGQTSPISVWVRGLAASISADNGKKVGLIGMCLTGGLVFAAVADPAMTAGVASQPSLPMPWLGPLTPTRIKRDLGTAPSDLAQSVGTDTPIMMLRYRGDFVCPVNRGETAAMAFGGAGQYQTDPIDGEVRVATGDQITMVEVAGKKHSVLTVNLNERARELVVNFLNEHLRTD